MTNAEIRNEIAKLEDIQIRVVENLEAYHAISDAIIGLQRQLYADQPAALAGLGL